LTDSHGRTVDFRNTVILMTSNVGARDAAKGSPLGFAGSGNDDPFDWSRLKSAILDEVNRIFRPEFINRVDESIVFRPLGRESVAAIVDIMFADVCSRLSGQGVELTVADEVKDLVREKGYQPKFGARPLRRTIQSLVEDPLADFLLENGASKGLHLGAAVSGGHVSFSFVPAAAEVPLEEHVRETVHQ